MKKLICILFCVLLCLSACGKEQSDINTENSQNSNEIIIGTEGLTENTTETIENNENQVSTESKNEIEEEDSEENNNQGVTNQGATNQGNANQGNANQDADNIKKYKYCYDINRDGVVTEAEIEAYDKRFYSSAPTSEYERKLLLAGYDVIVEFGNESYGVMVKAEAETFYAYNLLETYAMKRGYTMSSSSGGMLDEERHKFSMSTKPAITQIQLDGSWVGLNYNEEIYEKVYGYSRLDIEKWCTRYVKYGYYDGSIGYIENDFLCLTAIETKYICQIMEAKEPTEYLSYCPYELNKINKQIDEDEDIVSYYFYRSTEDTLTTEESLIEKAIAQLKKEYPGYDYTYRYTSSVEYIEGWVYRYDLIVVAPTDTTMLSCNQIGQTYAYNDLGRIDTMRIDSLNYEVIALSSNKVELQVNVKLTYVGSNFGGSERVHFNFCIYNEQNECVGSFYDISWYATDKSGRSYELPPGKYRIVFEEYKCAH